MNNWDATNLGPESRKAHQRRKNTGFFDQYFGGVVLDVGYRGYEEIDVVPVLPDAIGIDLNYPGYDGKRLPFEDGTVDTVYTSHVLEHIDDYVSAIRDWYRVLKVGGYMIIAVPHQFLYEKRKGLPSRWNMDHKRFYTPASLMREVEQSLPPNAYRVRQLIDDDQDYNYSIPPEQHAGGAYQIELVLEKLAIPAWTLEETLESKQLEADQQAKALLAEGVKGVGGRLHEVAVVQQQAILDLSSVVEMLTAFVSEQQAAMPLQHDPVQDMTSSCGLDDYKRADSVPVSDITGTTRFFRNRAQFQTILDRLDGNRVLIVGASRGCEAYSLAVEAALRGRSLDIDAVDIDPANIKTALSRNYPVSDFKDFDGTDLFSNELRQFFRVSKDVVQVDVSRIDSRLDFRVADLFDLTGSYDLVICNNVLIHFSDAHAQRALGVLYSLVQPTGLLVVGGISQHVLAGFIASTEGLSPVDDRLEEIWDSWKGDRLSWEQNPSQYCAMPPVDKTLGDWQVRFCTIFQKK